MNDSRDPSDAPDDSETEWLGVLAAGVPVRHPSPSLRARVLQALPSQSFTFLTAGQGIWLPGPNAVVATKELFVDSRDRASTRVIRLAPGATLPPPLFAGMRTLVVVSGSLVLGDKALEREDSLDGGEGEWRARTPTTLLEFSTKVECSANGAHPTSSAWTPVGPGMEARFIAPNEKERQVYVLRSRPRAVLPDHEHHGVEELYVLEGSCVVEGRELAAGDYHRAAAGSTHHETLSGEAGCVLVCSLRALS